MFLWQSFQHQPARYWIGLLPPPWKPFNNLLLAFTRTLQITVWRNFTICQPSWVCGYILCHPCAQSFLIKSSYMCVCQGVGEVQDCYKKRVEEGGVGGIPGPTTVPQTLTLNEFFSSNTFWEGYVEVEFVVLYIRQIGICVFRQPDFESYFSIKRLHLY